MANALFIGWGQPVHGREQQSLQLFNETLQYCRGLQQQGQIEAFEPVVLEPHGGDLAGFLLLRGDPGKLSQVRASEEFQIGALGSRSGRFSGGAGSTCSASW